MEWRSWMGRLGGACEGRAFGAGACSDPSPKPGGCQLNFPEMGVLQVHY